MNDQIKAMTDAFVEEARNPKKTIANAMKETGKKAFGVFPIYTPEEIIYAAGLLPVGMWGGQTTFMNVDKYIQSFCCSIMRANLELGMKGEYDFLEGVFIPTYCDTMKAILANWPIAVPNCKAIPFVYPQNRESSGSEAFLVAQLKGFKKDLEATIGYEIADEKIESAFEIYEEYREAMRDFTELANDYPKTIDPKTRHMIIKAAYFQDKKTYTEKLKALMDALKAQPKEAADGPKVIVTGLMLEPENVLDLFTEYGYAFVADDLAQESRQFRIPAREKGTAIEKMAGRIIDLKGCTFFYEEDKTRGTILANLAKKYKADGIVISMMKFCDPDEFDYPIIKKELGEAGVQQLYIEIDQQMDSVEQLRTRIQSFAEMLS